MTELKKSFIENMNGMLKEEASRFFSAMKEAPTRGIRVRSGYEGALSAFPQDVIGAVPWAKGGFYLSAGSMAGQHPYHDMGAHYLQEPSAMAPAALLMPREGERVLDLCAAPGGKTTQLADYMRGSGLLVANEPVQKRALVLSRNVERMGVQNAVVISEMPQKIAECLPEFFDAVLVDAPCSGEGMFRRHPEAIAEWTEDSPRLCAERQSGILDAAAKMLRAGGRLVYSTCTYNEIENEGTVLSFLARHEDFHLAPFALEGLGTAGAGYMHIFPHKVRGEGHFMALIIKDGESPHRAHSSGLKTPDKESAGLFQAFWRENFTSAAPAALMFGRSLLSCPADMPPLAGLHVLRAGLTLGEIKPGRFEPSHALALSALSGAAKRKYEVTLPQAIACQRGESFFADGAENGWTLLTLGGLPLMFSKCVDGQMKNHYPKGLRVSNRARDEWENDTGV
ncbi:MAG: RsmF rRNA methyltransferase first C-terminal domain-containing protein [Eubacteriales bacterium]|nr:RsmF rRNA methyltransferase first C-terminal domain-containing protein [Eubacteriales bacterium]MDD3881037.1 RsmF rRNA methyltransferase first C-terminal domain-containing protein [Eubacteriales bacterium]MDD4511894.1 RsmF rRNA methyltransferase first C-terminal domain-containing protein [Eubacteriales bacterium]